jgi:hypothetical protein
LRRIGRRPLIEKIYRRAKRLQGVGTVAAACEMGFDFGRHWDDAKGNVRQLIVNIPAIHKSLYTKSFKLSRNVS